MYMRKIILLLVVIGSSCSKSDSPAPTPEKIDGYWVGQYGRGSSAPTLPYMILFRENRTLRVYAGDADSTRASKAEGTYVREGGLLTVRYTYISGAFSGTYAARGNLNSAGNQLTGTYGSGTNTEGGGSFSLTRR